MFKRILIHVLLIMALAGGRAEAGGKTALVVRETSNIFYDQVLKGFGAAWDGEITLLVTEGKDVKAVMAAVDRIKPRLIVPFGRDGLRKVGGVERTPIVHVIVIKPREVVGEKENIVGISTKIPEEMVMEVIRTAMPRRDKIGVLGGKDDWLALERARAAAGGTGASLFARALKGRSEILDTIRDMRPHIGVLWIIRNRLFDKETMISIIRLATEIGLPVVSFSYEHMSLGAFMTVSLDLEDLGRQAADMGAKAMEGRKLASAEPRKYVVWLSRRVALKLNVDYKKLKEWYLID